MTVTVTEVPTNGKRPATTRDEGKAIIRQILAEGGKPSRQELLRRYGRSDGTWGNWITEVRNEAASAVPAAETNGLGEVTLPARSTVTRVKARRGKVAERAAVDWIIIAVVAAVAAIWSYSHIVDLAIAAGHGWRSYLLPVAIDGLLVAGVRAVGRDRHYPVAWIAIAVGVVGTVAGNVLAVRPELVDLADVAAVSAAFPAIALPVIVHLVRR